MCETHDKLLQLARIITHEAEDQRCSRFIIYFATCACVEYFYRVGVSLTCAADDHRSYTAHVDIPDPVIIPSIAVYSLFNTRALASRDTHKDPCQLRIVPSCAVVALHPSCH